MSEQMNNLHVSNIFLTYIQRFSLHDGPGIRTTVFLKGCSLRCPWCSNPENISSNIQTYLKDGVEGIYGKYMSTDELYTEVMKDKPFYTGDITDYNINMYDQIEDLPGGVTFSGGECLLQIEALQPLLQRLKVEHVHTAVETCLFIPKKDLNLAIRYIDFFYVDIKILDEEYFYKYLHGDLKLYLSNLNILLHSGKPVVFRIPVIGGYTDGDENRRKIISLIDKYAKDENANLLKVEIIKEHNLGTTKYQSLAVCNNGYEVTKYKGVSDELMKLYKKEIIEKIDNKIPVEICKV